MILRLVLVWIVDDDSLLTGYTGISMKLKWNKVTWFSTLLAVTLFALAIFLAAVIGLAYWQTTTGGGIKKNVLTIRFKSTVSDAQVTAFFNKFNVKPLDTFVHAGPVRIEVPASLEPLWKDGLSKRPEIESVTLDDGKASVGTSR